MSLKASAEDFRVCLQQLAQQPWIQRTERRWWPQFAFHYTDIRNVVSILQEGKLYSRAQAEQKEKIAVSSGSAQVLAGTQLNILDSVRLYFRPKTPTQYWAEGVHSRLSLAQSRFPDAHCPVPVFFLFDLPQVLALPESQFSDRTLAAHNGYRLGQTPRDLQTLPWEKIYHTDWIDWNNPESAREVVACRNAEIIVPRELDLSALRYIYCRSEAEKDTLLHLLPSALRQRYQDKIVASTRNELYFRRRTFIERAVLMSSQVFLRFSPETEVKGPFHLKIEINAGQILSRDAPDFSIPPYEYVFALPRALSGYQIGVTLDENLVYANTFNDTNLPF